MCKSRCGNGKTEESLKRGGRRSAGRTGTTAPCRDPPGHHHNRRQVLRVPTSRRPRPLESTLATSAATAGLALLGTQPEIVHADRVRWPPRAHPAARCTNSRTASSSSTSRASTCGGNTFRSGRSCRAKPDSRRGRQCSRRPQRLGHPLGVAAIHHGPLRRARSPSSALRSGRPYSSEFVDGSQNVVGQTRVLLDDLLAPAAVAYSRIRQRISGQSSTAISAASCAQYSTAAAAPGRCGSTPRVEDAAIVGAEPAEHRRVMRRARHRHRFELQDLECVR